MLALYAGCRYKAPSPLSAELLIQLSFKEIPSLDTLLFEIQYRVTNCVSDAAKKSVGYQTDWLQGFPFIAFISASLSVTSQLRKISVRANPLASLSLSV
jgi:hypothetical protein